MFSSIAVSRSCSFRAFSRTLLVRASLLLALRLTGGRRGIRTTGGSIGSVIFGI